MGDDIERSLEVNIGCNSGVLFGEENCPVVKSTNKVGYSRVPFDEAMLVFSD